MRSSELLELSFKAVSTAFKACSLSLHLLSSVSPYCSASTLVFLNCCLATFPKSLAASLICLSSTSVSLQALTSLSYSSCVVAPFLSSSLASSACFFCALSLSSVSATAFAKRFSFCAKRFVSLALSFKASSTAFKEFLVSLSLSVDTLSCALTCCFSTLPNSLACSVKALKSFLVF